MFYRVVLVFALMTCSISGYEYLYPVAHIHKNHEQYLYLLYQKSSCFQLLVWDPHTKIISKALPSHCVPAGLRVLPDNSGFSFIDNGRIKVKLFNKRSPKSIDFYESLYDIEMIEWITASSFYFSAKESGYSAIFQADMHGCVHTLCGGDIDCMYPQKIDRSLFYIERTIIKNQSLYRIIRAVYPEISDKNDTFNTATETEFDVRVEELLKEKKEKPNKTILITDEHKECIADLKDQPIAFLKMISEHEGFFISHDKAVYDGDNTIAIAYHRMEKKDGTWGHAYLFSFSIPLFLLKNEKGSSYYYRSENKDRVYESMLRFLPCHRGDDIYFMDCARDSRTLDIFKYNQLTKLIAQQTASKDQHYFFALLPVENNIYYGGALENNNDKDKVPKGMWLNQDGHACYELCKL